MLYLKFSKAHSSNLLLLLLIHSPLRYPQQLSTAYLTRIEYYYFNISFLVLIPPLLSPYPSSCAFIASQLFVPFPVNKVIKSHFNFKFNKYQRINVSMFRSPPTTISPYTPLPYLNSFVVVISFKIEITRLIVWS